MFVCLFVCPKLYSYQLSINHKLSIFPKAPKNIWSVTGQSRSNKWDSQSDFYFSFLVLIQDQFSAYASFSSNDLNSIIGFFFFTFSQNWLLCVTIKRVINSTCILNTCHATETWSFQAEQMTLFPESSGLDFLDHFWSLRQMLLESICP